MNDGEIRQHRRGITLFLTGLPGAGKSTIAAVLYTKLLKLQDRAITLLDGDVVRQHLSNGLGFSREDRDANIARIGFVAGEVTKHGGIAICAAIAPYRKAREKNRAHINQWGRYVEIYVGTPLSECKRRDPKGLYRKAEAGLITRMTGVDDPYEPPESPDIAITTLDCSATEAAEKIIALLEKRGLLF